MNLCNANQLLKDNSIRLTKQRVDLMQYIHDYGRPFSVADIHADNLHLADLATVYRFIRLLQQNGLIRSVAQYDDTQYYELACEHNPNHPHFICKNCHHLICLNTLRTADVLRLAEYAKEQSVEDISISYSGICSECKANKGIN